ncbi:unnamed protein product [Acanthoscelides obtectus]|uniref:Uncharacterized protein n=1 Tax=Acanthoscelides obtectus TaxID=200917 RepID=A0A9P0K8X6_ACAOB|nr:unnamed protein product [Acanthoscelides obtectus]CAK1645712.1 hypothetical protein AOBTE_LOCUS14221 [Acanthoscelides obtectus]
MVVYSAHQHHERLGEHDEDRPMPVFADTSKLPVVESLEAMRALSRSNLLEDKSDCRYDPNRHILLDGSRLINEMKSLAEIQEELKTMCTCDGQDQEVDEMAAAAQKEPSMSVYDPEVLNTTMAPRINSFMVRRRLLWSSFLRDLETYERNELVEYEEKIRKFHESRRQRMLGGQGNDCVEESRRPCSP